MAKDVNELVLDAFRVEHREQLEQIRTLLAALAASEHVANDPRVQDAFRLAHSFKGGARVCDLREAERLGHGLEAVLERLNHGALRLTGDVTCAVTLVLDSIEDWMSALDDAQPAPDISEALAVIDRVLTEAAIPTTKPAEATKSSQLFQVFCQEHAQHSARLHQLLAGWSPEDYVFDNEEIWEAARLAHTLGGAAAIVDIRPVETNARQLEHLFRTAHVDRKRLDANTLRQINESLDAMDQAIRTANAHSGLLRNPHEEEPRSPAPNTPETDAEKGQSITTDTISAPNSAPATIPFETVRVSVETLDRLMRSSSEMVADNQHVSRLTRQLAALRLDVEELEREREAVRRVASPNLHKLAAMPEFGRVARYFEYIDRKINSLAKRARQVSAIHRQVTWLLRARSAQVQRDVHEARLVPAHSVFQGFRKMIRDVAKSEGREIDFDAEGLDVRADRMVLQELKDSIMHLLRNCVSHGIETTEQRIEIGKPERGRVSLKLEAANGRLVAVIEDDGRGIDLEQIKLRAIDRGLLTAATADHQSIDQTLSLLFEAGFSTVDSVTELAGRGMGLSVVQETVTRLQGHVALAPRESCGVCVTLSVPISVSTHRLLLVGCGNETFAIPTRSIERLLRIAKDQMETVEGQPVVMYGRRPIRLARLSDVLGQSSPPTAENDDNMLSVVLLRVGTGFLAVSVDTLLDERDSLILNLDEFAESNRFAGGILLDDGQAALVVRTSGLLDAAQHTGGSRAPIAQPAAQPSLAKKVLIVDDSFTTRTLEKSILESQGYEVGVAVDGLEAISLLQQQKFDLVISDVEMPRMDGFALLEQIKADKRLANTPVILVTSRDRREDQQHGLDLGADAYIVKRKFDHQELLNTIRQLL